MAATATETDTSAQLEPAEQDDIEPAEARADEQDLALFDYSPTEHDGAPRLRKAIRPRPGRRRGLEDVEKPVAAAIRRGPSIATPPVNGSVPALEAADPDERAARKYGNRRLAGQRREHTH
jgi:hypothetical protein